MGYIFNLDLVCINNHSLIFNDLRMPHGTNFMNTGEANPHIIIVARKMYFFIWIHKRGLGS